MLSDDGRMPMVDDIRDGKRKLEDFGSIYGLDHGATATRPINESPGKQIIICTIRICATLLN